MFLSFSATAKADRTTVRQARFPQDYYYAAYLEYGLTPALTVGVDAGYGTNGDHTVLAFARHPVLQGRAGANVFALKAGAGTTRTGGQSQTLVMAGADWGRGFDTIFGDGWLSLETGLHYFTERGEVAAKADLTAGVKAGDMKFMLQLQSGKYPGGDPYLRLVPSIAREVSAGQHVEVGLEAGLIGDDRIGVKVGAWLEF
ncbi:MAG: hypothetical protein QNJ16_04940 [Rhodobacter sp.]|nr:hypothetical protein [Rhodobacter sp.]